MVKFTDDGPPEAGDSHIEFKISMPVIGVQPVKLMHEDYATSTLIELKRHTTTVEQEEKQRKKAAGKSLASGSSGQAVTHLREARAAKRAADSAKATGGAAETADADGRSSKRRRKEDDPLWSVCQHLMK